MGCIYTARSLPVAAQGAVQYCLTFTRSHSDDGGDGARRQPARAVKPGLYFSVKCSTSLTESPLRHQRPSPSSPAALNIFEVSETARAVIGPLTK